MAHILRLTRQNGESARVPERSFSYSQATKPGGSITAGGQEDVR